MTRTNSGKTVGMGTFTSHVQRRFCTFLYCLGCGAIGGAAAAFAQDPRPEYVDQACLEIEGPIEDAVRFVEEAQGISLSPICIKSVPKEAIMEAFSTTAGMSKHQPNVGGLYVIAEETILIPYDLDLHRVSDLSFVVHEIVHAYQHQTGMLLPDASLGLLECDAYYVQAAFLRSRGLPREALLMSLQAELQMGSVCEY